MSEEAQAETTDTQATESPADASTQPAATKKRPSRRLVVIGVILVVLAGAGVGGWIWHEQPSFCSAICHTPMDEYFWTWEAEPGQAAEDKYGNAVADADAMLAANHGHWDVGCLDCHVPTIGEMVAEGLAWIPGNYYYPLSERDLVDLTTARKLEPDEFCLNDGCHHVGPDGSTVETREQLEAAGEDLAFNPHSSFHDEYACGDCHKAHRASVNICSRPGCHSDAPLPDGWLSYPESLDLDLYLSDPEE